MAYRIIIIILIIVSTTFCFGTSFKAVNNSTLKSDPHSYHHIVGCSIFDKNGKKIWHYNGYICLFQKNGSFVVAEKNRINMYDKNFNLLWTINRPIHHQVNWNNDKTEILAMSEIYKPFGKELVKYDNLLVIDLNGIIKKEFSFYKHRGELDKISSDNTYRFWEINKDIRRNHNVSKEFSHSNSFYQIPQVRTTKLKKVFSSDNYIVNVNKHYMIIVLDKDLSKILWSINHKEIGNDVNMHDVQVTQNGMLIYYYNRLDQKYSTIERYNLQTKKSEILYASTPKNSFFEKYDGGVQLLENGNIFFHLMKNKRFTPIEYDFKGTKKIVWSKPMESIIHQKQQIKRANLSDFLMNNKGL